MVKATLQVVTIISFEITKWINGVPIDRFWDK
jgi:hypothetical protein